MSPVPARRCPHSSSGGASRNRWHRSHRVWRTRTPRWSRAPSPHPSATDGFRAVRCQRVFQRQSPDRTPHRGSSRIGERIRVLLRWRPGRAATTILQAHPHPRVRRPCAHRWRAGDRRLSPVPRRGRQGGAQEAPVALAEDGCSPAGRRPQLQRRAQRAPLGVRGRQSPSRRRPALSTVSMRWPPDHCEIGRCGAWPRLRRRSR